MSPIGKVFVVLNLLLAGAFVGFSGTYLQKATDWKQKHDAVQVDMTKQLEAKDSDIAKLTSDFNTKDRQLVQSDSVKAKLETDLASVTREKDDLDKKLSSLEASFSELKADYGSVASAIKSATELSNEARQEAIAAAQARDDAVREKEKAVADFRDASDKIASLESDLGAAGTRIDALVADVRQKDTILEYVNTRAPGILGLAQPSLKGTVQHVDAAGRLLTVAVAENPSDAEIKAGYEFAIYAGEVYKGEAQVTSVKDNRFAFCRVIKAPAGSPKIRIGDAAATVTN